jgi:hypothetical protein
MSNEFGGADPRYIKRIQAKVNALEESFGSATSRAFLCGQKAKQIQPLIHSQEKKVTDLRSSLSGHINDLEHGIEKSKQREVIEQENWNVFWNANKDRFELSGFAEAKTYKEPNNLTYLTYLLFFAEAILAFFIAYGYFTGETGGFNLVATVKSLVLAALVIFVSIVLTYSSYIMPIIFRTIFMVGSLLSSALFVVSMIYLRGHDAFKALEGTSSSPRLFGLDQETLTQGAILGLLIFGKCFLESIDKDPVLAREASEITRNGSKLDSSKEDLLRQQSFLANLQQLKDKYDTYDTIALKKGVLHAYIEGAESFWAFLYSRAVKRERMQLIASSQLDSIKNSEVDPDPEDNPPTGIRGRKKTQTRKSSQQIH